MKSMHKTKSKKPQLGQNFADDYQYRTWPEFLSFYKVSIKSMHPCKSYWAETNINTPTKSKSKKGHNSANCFADDYLYRTWPVFYNDISIYKLSIKSMQPCKSYLAETVINTPTKIQSKKGHNSAKILRIIINIDLYFKMIYPSTNLQ